MGDLCQCFPECADDPDVDSRTVADGAKAGINWKKILCNINLIAIILGIVLFFTQIRLPVILGNTMSQISATLGPVCMIMLGMTMTEVKWKDIFSHSRIYLITILKMVVTPLLILLFLKYLPWLQW